MYLPEHFRESRIELLHNFIRRHPLAVLVAMRTEGLSADHIPMQLWPRSDGVLTLRGHIARSNSLWRVLNTDAPILAIFGGAAHYISPSWYPSKRSSGKVVPTWNYSAVHVAGQIRFIEDSSWLRALVESLTDQHEAEALHRWKVSDAPEDYIQAMLQAIVGFEICVTSIQGKFKASQNRNEADRAGVARALQDAGLPIDDVAELARDPGPSPVP